VLVTGTAGSGHKRANTLFDRDGGMTTIDWQHLPGHFVGAGCTLSGALTAFMARGMDAADALRAAQEYTYGALLHAQRFGMGKLVPNRFFHLLPPAGR
jgi:hydroxymethylpyrimidine/phosphomethylpyrimidine kinase